MDLTRRGFVAACASTTAGIAAAGEPLDAERSAAGPRIASLELILTETLIGLGRPPIANANNPLYRKLIGRPELPATVTDLGPAQEPNLEYLRVLSPDMILLTEWQAGIAETVRAAGPVVRIDTIRPGRSPLDAVRDVTEDVARIVGRPAAGQAAVATLAVTLGEARDKLAGAARRRIVLARFLEDGRHLAVFGSRSMVGAVLAEAGLLNAWTGRQNAIGTVLVPIEALAAASDAIVVHFDRGPETARALVRLSANPLWSALPFAQPGRTIAMPVIHPNGGLESARRFARQLVDIRTALDAG